MGQSVISLRFFFKLFHVFLYLYFIAVIRRPVKFLAGQLIRQILLLNIMIRKIVGIQISASVSGRPFFWHNK